MTEHWLLLHGTPLDPSVWDGVRPQLEVTHPVLAPLLPVPSTDVEVQAALAQAVLGDIDQDLALHVVGHSFGGQVALEVALQVPQQVRSLTILCSRASPFPAFAGAAANLRAGGPVDLDGALARWFRPAELDAGGHVVAATRRCLDEVDRTMWAAELDAIATYDRHGDLGRITAPTTVIAAELDPVGTPEEMTAMAAAIPGAHVEVLLGAAHMSPFLDPTSLAHRFIAASRRSSS